MIVRGCSYHFRCVSIQLCVRIHFRSIRSVVPKNKVETVQPRVVEKINEDFNLLNTINDDIIEDTFDETDENDMEGSNTNSAAGKVLLKLSRSKYRHVDVLPEWITEKQNEVCSYRSMSQIRRCLKSWMLEVNREVENKFLKRPLTWSTKPEPKNESTQKIYGPDETVAYTHYFFPSRYTITKRIMDELHIISPHFKPKRIIDFGCGPGTSGLAAHTVWSDASIKYSGIDMSQSMIDAAKLMLSNILPQHQFFSKTGELIKHIFSGKESRYDLSIMSYTLSELPNDTARRAAVQLMYELLDSGGYLIMIEAGNPRGSHIIRTARQFLLDGFPRTKDTMDGDPSDPMDQRKKKKRSEDLQMILPALKGLHYASVVAPCLHDKTCPLVGSSSWCSFSQKVISSMIRKQSEEKFSYFIIHKRPNTSPNEESSPSEAVPSNWFQEANADEVSVVNVLKHLEGKFRDNKEKEFGDYVDKMDWDAFVPVLRRNEWSRIIRSPIKSSGHVTLDICASDGLISRKVISKQNVLPVPNLYSAVRKAEWGGLLPSVCRPDRKEILLPLLLQHNKGLKAQHFTARTSEQNKAKPPQQTISNTKNNRKSSAMEMEIDDMFSDWNDEILSKPKKGRQIKQLSVLQKEEEEDDELSLREKKLPPTIISTRRNTKIAKREGVLRRKLKREKSNQDEETTNELD